MLVTLPCVEWSHNAWIWKCLYVCVYVCNFVCMCVHRHRNAYNLFCPGWGEGGTTRSAPTYKYAFLRRCVCVCVCVHVHVLVHTCTKNLFTKTDKSIIFVNLRYLRLKLQEHKIKRKYVIFVIITSKIFLVM